MDDAPGGKSPVYQLTFTTITSDAYFPMVVLTLKELEAHMTESRKLAFNLTNDQLKALKPLLDQTGKLKIAGEIEGNRLNVSFLACNMAFIACNMAFTSADGVVNVQAKK